MRSDNITIVADVNHRGGLRSHCLHEMMWELLLWAQTHLALLLTAHMSGIMITATDILMRWFARGKLALAPSGGSSVLRQVWESIGGSVCLSGEHSLPPLVLNVGSPRASGPGCPHSQLANDNLLHLSSTASDPSDSRQSCVRGGHQLLLIASYWPRCPWFSLLLPLLSGAPWQLPQRPDRLFQAQKTQVASGLAATLSDTASTPEVHFWPPRQYCAHILCQGRLH